MKTRLSYKIFAAFVAMSFMMVALMVVSYRYVVVTSFWDYVNQNILGRLTHVCDALASEYQVHQGWDFLKAVPDRWQEILADSIPKDDFGRWAPPPLNKAERNTPPSMPKGFPRPADGPLEGEDKTRFLSFRLARTLVLFDLQHQYLAGHDAVKDPRRYSLRAIEVSGRPVGWLGLMQREHAVDPFFMDFIKEQSLIFYSIGGTILLLAAVVALIFSRHLLKPIQQLIQGTRDLTTFRFDTRIPICSSDELGQLARDFNRMADTLKAYETMRQQWISDISHELRTPLAILKGEIEAIQDGVRQSTPRTLASLHAEVMRLSKLVSDLHALSLADTQNLQAIHSDVKPLAILQQMVSHYQSRLERGGIELRMNPGPADTLVIRGDHDRLAQLFANLLENTLRYTDSPGILKIDAHQDARAVTIVFEDTAPGVPPHAQDRIFERLYRVDSSRNRRLGGSGLGLAICKQIVVSHGGTIQASAAPSGGLSIQIQLPLKNAER